MKKVLTIVGGLVVGLVVLGLAIFFFVSGTSKKLACKSSSGTITIMYNDEKLTGYTANGYTFDQDGQNDIVKQIGIDAYIQEFEAWMASEPDGSCTRK